jgi:hypothetical protein
MTTRQNTDYGYDIQKLYIEMVPEETRMIMGWY